MSAHVAILTVMSPRSAPQLADLNLRPASLGWWSLFNLPRHVLPIVLGSFATALRPGGQLIIATHVGDNDVEHTEAYNGVPVQWMTYQWQPEQLIALVQQAGLRLVADLRLPADPLRGPATVVVAQRVQLTAVS